MPFNGFTDCPNCNAPLDCEGEVCRYCDGNPSPALAVEGCNKMKFFALGMALACGIAAQLLVQRLVGG